MLYARKKRNRFLLSITICEEKIRDRWVDSSTGHGERSCRCSWFSDVEYCRVGFMFSVPDKLVINTRDAATLDPQG